jgi:transporter family protein
MSWLAWSLLSAFFAGITAILAKVGVENVNSNLATAIRTTVVLVFTWGIAYFAAPAGAMAGIGRRTDLERRARDCVGKIAAQNAD